MEVFIGNLAPGTTLAELLAHFKGYGSKARFRMEQKRLEDGKTVYYAVASFDNDKLALKMIEKFAGQPLQGQSLVVREYVHRTYTNERRAVNWREKPWRAGERRRNDRRLKKADAQRDEFEEILASSQANEKSEDELVDSLKVEGYRDFARKS